MQIHKKPLLFLLLALSVIASVFAAQVLLNKPLRQHGNIMGSADLQIIREDDGNEILDVVWGSFNPFSIVSKTSLEILGTRICIKNVGNMPLVVAWNCSGKPDYLDLTATWSGYPYLPNDFTQFRIDPGYINGYVIFNLTLNDLTTPSQNFDFNMTFWAAEAP